MIRMPVPARAGRKRKSPWIFSIVKPRIVLRNGGQPRERPYRHGREACNSRPEMLALQLTDLAGGVKTELMTPYLSSR